MKLTKAETKLHDQAVALLEDDLQHLDVRCPFCSGERNEFGRTETNLCEHCDYGVIAAPEFVLRYWRPGASNNIGKGGIFFTPHPQAWDAACWHGGHGRVVDCCAGIGMLAYHLSLVNNHSAKSMDLTCIEINPEFVEIGKKIVPHAHWICGNAFDVLPELDVFDSGISNPPFGNIPSCAGRSKAFKSNAHFAIMELLLRHCRNGSVVIIPDNDHSRENINHKERSLSSEYQKFVELYPEASITPGSYEPFSEGWHGANIRCQICDLGTPNCSSNPYLQRPIGNQLYTTPGEHLAFDALRALTQQPKQQELIEA